MQIILFDTDEAYCAEAERIAEQSDTVTALCASYAELCACGLATEGAVALLCDNAFGILHADIPQADALGRAIKEAIIADYGPELPVGCAVQVMRGADGERVIYAPTMQGPMCIDGTDGLYRAARAAAHLAIRDGVDQLFIGVCAGAYDGMNATDALAQMMMGVADAQRVITPDEMDWTHADSMHQRWHTCCGVPDDGYRWADEMEGGHHDTVDHPTQD